MTTSAAILKRVSTDLTRQEISNQDADTARVVRDNDLSVVRTFEVEASAFHGKHQPTLDRIIAEVRQGLYTVVVIAMTSRIERRGWKALMRFLLELDSLGARVIAADNPTFGQLDDDNPLGAAMTILTADSDRKYSQTISDNVNRAFQRMDKANAFRGVAPTGYQSLGPEGAKQLVKSDGICHHPNPEGKYHKRCKVTATQVAEAIRECASGASTVTLGKRLGMTSDAVGKMIRNPVYGTGRYEIHRKDGSTYVHRCEPIVDPDIQKSAIAALEGRRKGDNVSSRAITKEDFSGAVWCGWCASETPTQGRMYRYFGGGRKRADGTTGPKARRYLCETCKRSVKADEADKAVQDTYGTDDSWWFRSRVIPGDDHSAELARLRDELDGLGARRLPRTEMLAETTRLYDEIERLESLPSRPARTVIERVKDNEGNLLTEGYHWGLLGASERREWVLSRATVSHYPTVKAAPGRKGTVELDTVYVPGEADTAEVQQLAA